VSPAAPAASRPIRHHSAKCAPGKTAWLISISSQPYTCYGRRGAAPDGLSRVAAAGSRVKTPCKEAE